MKIKLYDNRDFWYRKNIQLHIDDIHIWKIQWEDLIPFWERHINILELEEYQRMVCYRFYDDKMRYLAGKILTKLLLQSYLGIKNISLQKGKYGKPYYRVPAGKREVRFNISHSGEWILAIFSYHRNVGIDVQKIDEISNYMDIAQNFFSKVEAIDIQKVKSSELFYQYWSAKEAYLKALGVGLRYGMDFFSVMGNRIIENGEIKEKWVLYPVKIKGYVAYAAVQKKE